MKKKTLKESSNINFSCRCCCFLLFYMIVFKVLIQLMRRILIMVLIERKKQRNIKYEEECFSFSWTAHRFPFQNMCKHYSKDSSEYINRCAKGITRYYLTLFALVFDIFDIFIGILYRFLEFFFLC